MMGLTAAAIVEVSRYFYEMIFVCFAEKFIVVILWQQDVPQTNEV